MDQNVDSAALVAIDCLDGIAIGSNPLVIGDESGVLVQALRSRGVEAATWNRRYRVQHPGRTWPASAAKSDQCYTSALLRLPKAKDALDFALHAAASVTPPGATLVLFGANDEGARSAATRFAAIVDPVATLATRRHCRVMAGPRRSAFTGLKDSLSLWRTDREITILGTRRKWVGYPGVFARGGLDGGTAFLIANLPRLTPRTRVLDFAGGTGVIASAVLQTTPGIAIDLIEIDALALDCARANVPDARCIAGDSLAVAEAARYDVILSNPPVHEGIADDLSILRALITAAPRYLNREGELRIVVQRRIPAMAVMEAALKEVRVLAANAGFQVIAGKRN